MRSVTQQAEYFSEERRSVKKILHFTLSYSGLQLETEFFFFYLRVKNIVRGSGNIFLLQYIRSAHCYKPPVSRITNDSSNEPFTANNTLWLRGLLCKEEKLLYRRTCCTFFISLLHPWALFVTSSSPLQIQLLWIVKGYCTMYFTNKRLPRGGNPCKMRQCYLSALTGLWTVGNFIVHLRRTFIF